MAGLHPQLAQDTVELGRFALCRLLLMNDANYPWFILVPDREGITEIHQLNSEERQQLMAESCLVAEAIEQAFSADKINIAALGNLVAQLHIHHVVRYRNDPAWPKPIWGAVAASPYSEGGRSAVIARLKAHLKDGIAWAV